MSDARLRELERRWRASGRVEDEAAWLKERVRQGLLAAEALEVASQVGHPAARLAFGAGEDDPPFDAWSVAISELGLETAARAAIAGAREGLASITVEARREFEPILDRLQGLLVYAPPDAAAALRREGGYVHVPDGDLGAIEAIHAAFYCLVEGDPTGAPPALQLAARALGDRGERLVRHAVVGAVSAAVLGPRGVCRICGEERGLDHPCTEHCRNCDAPLSPKRVCSRCGLDASPPDVAEETAFEAQLEQGRAVPSPGWSGSLVAGLFAGAFAGIATMAPCIFAAEVLHWTRWQSVACLAPSPLAALATSVCVVRWLRRSS